MREQNRDVNDTKGRIDGEEQNVEIWPAAAGEDDICSEAFLRRVTKEENLSAVHNLVLTVDTTVTQVTQW